MQLGCDSSNAAFSVTYLFLSLQKSKKVWTITRLENLKMMSSGAFFSEIEDDYEAVKSIIGRHPMNQFEVRGFLESRDVKDPEAMMEQMKKDEAIHVIDYKGILTFRLK